MRSVLLLGASGFIGARARAALEAHPVVSRVACPGRSRLDLFAAGADGVAGLLREEQPDVVVNCTGRLDGAMSDHVEANTLVTARIIDAIAEVRPVTRLVRIGSAGEYGPMIHGESAREDGPAAPVSSYGLSHLAGTQLLTLARVSGRADGVTLRVFNPIGPGVREETLLGRAVGRIRHALDTGAATVTLGPLGAYRDFVDTRDVAAAITAAAVAPDLPHPVLNIGSGRAVVIRDAVRKLADAAGFVGAVREEGAATGRSAAVDWSQADIGRATTSLGWRPEFDLDQTVKAIWADVDGPAEAAR